MLPLTVSEFLTIWMREYGESEYRPSTRDFYHFRIRTNVNPLVGDISLEELTADDLQDLYDELSTSGRKDGSGGLSPTTIRTMHSMLNKALNWGVENGYLSSNPVKDLDSPPNVRRPPARYWSKDQTKVFLEASRGSTLYDLYLTLLMTGMRRREALGLTWQDVCFEKQYLHIRRSLIRVPTGTVRLDPLPPEEQREVRIPGVLVELLKGAYKEVAQRSDAESLAVFADDSSEPLHPTAVTDKFRYDVHRIPDLPLIGLKGLRNTHAALMIASGTHPEELTEHMDYNSIRYLLNRHGSVYKGIQEGLDRMAKEIT